MRRSYIPAIALLLVGGLACDGGPGGNPDGGTGGPADVAYFGFETGTCYRYVDRTGIQQYTVGVETENDALGFVARQVSYRIGGFEVRRDYVTFDDGQMYVHRRVEADNTIYDFNPPFTLFDRPLQRTLTNPPVTETTATNAVTLDTEQWRVRVDVDAQTAVTVPERTDPYDAWPVFVSYERAEAATDKIWMVPESGPVRVDLDVPSWESADLVQSWQSEDGSCSNAP